MNWQLSFRADQTARQIADRHYNRQKIGSMQFVPPGSCIVLSIPGQAVWVTSVPIARYVKHQWAGAWMNSLFRRESGPLASQLIREAIACTRWKYGEPPELGMVTFIDTRRVLRKRDPGRCYLRAGFRKVGHTKGGLLALQMLPADMPPAAAPLGACLDLFVQAAATEKEESYEERNDDRNRMLGLRQEPAAR